MGNTQTVKAPSTEPTLSIIFRPAKQWTNKAGTKRMLYFGFLPILRIKGLSLAVQISGNLENDKVVSYNVDLPRAGFSDDGVQSTPRVINADGTKFVTDPDQTGSDSLKLLHDAIKAAWLVFMQGGHKVPEQPLSIAGM